MSRSSQAQSHWRRVPASFLRSLAARGRARQGAGGRRGVPAAAATTPRRRRWRRPAGAVGAIVLFLGLISAVHPGMAFATASGPPPFPSDCPQAQYPPPGYPNPPPSAAAPYVYDGKAYSGPIPYEVPFKAIIVDGQISLPPNVVIPHIYASTCGVVQLPQLSGTILGSDINLAAVNVYVAGLEALPVNVSFGTLQSTISPAPAPNGGLDITVEGSTTNSVTTLGMTCSLTLEVSFTTSSSGALTGEPVTGATTQGQAEIVSNSFAVPAIVGSQTDPSNKCPVPIADNFNKLLQLPAGPGTGKFTAPFCFDFELEGINDPLPTPECPWPSS